MSDKRRDTKGRLLKSGERQREDGKYEYRYYDQKGVRRSVYSWKLVDTDKLPPGKRCKESLRSIEKRIRRDIEDGIQTQVAEQTTLNLHYEKYIATKKEIKESTRENYKYMYDKYVREEIGYMKLVNIKFSDIRAFYLSLIHEKGFKPNSIEIIHSILHPIFDTAVRDCIIRLNPTDGVIKEIKKTHNWKKTKRKALTETQQSAFISYVSSSTTYKHWYPLFVVLLGTGCRIGEVLGLRWQDCDFAEGIISINHNLIYRKRENTGKMGFSITTPKTDAGMRIIPMLEDVKQVLLQERIRQMTEGFNDTVIEGYTGFIFSSRYGDALNPHCVNRAIQRICRDYNLQETENAKAEKRPPQLLPHFSCHNLRHTFCTRYCKVERDLKAIQEVMGHASITTTMDIYNESSQESKIVSFAHLEGKIQVC